MTGIDTTTSRPPSSAPTSAAVRRSFPAALPAVYRAELIGLRTVRSTGYLAVAAALCIVFVGVGGVLAGPTSGTTAQDATGAALGGVGSAVVVVAALGVLAVTGDYASGVLGAVVTAVPRRSLVLVAKLGALVTVVLPVTVGSALISLLAVRLLPGRPGVTISLVAPGVARAVLGVGLYLSAVAVLAAGLGWLLRSTAGALVSWLGLWTLPTFGVLLLPPARAAALGRLTPGEAGGTIATPGPGGELAAWADLAVLLAYAALVNALALLLFRRRDV